MITLPSRIGAILACLALCGSVTAVSAQEPPNPGGRGRHAAVPGAPGTLPEPTLKPDPRQRLDPGALLCESEAALQQRQAAILARLSHLQTSYPTGCHILGAMTPVAVLARHGPASTEVRLPGPPERVGWTDSMIHDLPPNAR